MCAVLAFVSSLTAAADHGRIPSEPTSHTTAPTVAAHIGLERNNRLVATQALRLGNGHTRTRKRQIYNDVPVYGYGVVVKRGPRGNLLDVDGVVARHLSRNLVDARPRLTPPQAPLTLQRSLNQASKRVRNVKAELFVQPGGDRTARLIYRVSYLAGSGNNISRPTAIIDANTDEIIRQWNGLTTGRRPRGGGATPTPVRAIGPGGNGVTGLYLGPNEIFDSGACGDELAAEVRCQGRRELQRVVAVLTGGHGPRSRRP